MQQTPPPLPELTTPKQSTPFTIAKVIALRRNAGNALPMPTCKVRYSNNYLQGIVDEYSNYGYSNNENVSTIIKDVDMFMRRVGDTLHDLGTQFSSQTLRTLNDRRYFGTKSMSLNSVKLYTMAQCLADLAPSDCERCLGFVINELSTCCYGSKGGTAVNPSCYARYEIYPFYKGVSSPSPSPPLSPPPDLSKGVSSSILSSPPCTGVILNEQFS
ncbi:putative cysteine-rich repeat secretory protein 24 [Bienertia sinuspersici]